MHAVSASAQTLALAGRVLRAGSASPIGGAEILLFPGGSRAVTDGNGEFHFDAVTSGRVVLHVRRLGFAAESLAVDVPRGNRSEIIIELRESAQKLDTVSVTGQEAVLTRGKLAGFYERKKFGIGRFLEQQDIEKFLSRRLADIIVARMPGTRAVRNGKAGMAAYIATVRMMPHALLGGAPSTGQSAPAGGAFSRSPRVTTCYPDVYLDGVIVYSSGLEMQQDVGDVRFDVNSIDPAQVSALEFYSGAAQMPAQYNRTGAACGALLIWTK